MSLSVEFQFAAVFKLVLKNTMGMEEVEVNMLIPKERSWNSYYESISKMLAVFDNEQMKVEYIREMLQAGYLDVCMMAEDINWLRQYANVCTPPLALSTGQSELFIVYLLADNTLMIDTVYNHVPCLPV